MKRFSTLLLIILLSAMPATLLAGCGSDTGRAREYMQAGDNIMNDIKGESMNLKDLGVEIDKMIEAIFTGPAPSSKDMIKKADEFDSAVRKIDKYAGEATMEYKKILALEGVPYYSDYAGKAIEYINTMKELYKKYGEMLDYVVETLQMSESDEAIDSTAFSITLQDSFNAMGEISAKAEKINDERSELKKEKDL